jgi:hypothetical protein
MTVPSCIAPGVFRGGCSLTKAAAALKQICTLHALASRALFIQAAAPARFVLGMNSHMLNGSFFYLDSCVLCCMMVPN